MSTSVEPLHRILRAPAVSSRTVTVTFAATTFVASGLLFLVEPMFARMVLPRLGGSAAVWTTCVLFFQTTLLLGYLYAHLTVRWLGVRRQAMLHLLVMVAALPFLPLTLGDSVPPPDGSPVVWLLTTLTLRLGVPFFALSALAPLVQRWFATLPVPGAANPYALYAASNTGSVLALLAYPFVLEPLWGTRTHAWGSAAGYVALLALVAVCAVCLRDDRRVPDTAPAGTRPWSIAARWVALALVPSSLMLGVTTHISTDLATVPLLWVLPMAAYLLTFVLAFSARDWIPRLVVTRALPVLVLATLLSIAFQAGGPWLIPLHLAAFFAAALSCHDALARSRPPAQDLTAFYVWMSLGGLLGGLFNTLVAPTLFTGIFEYPIMLAVACLARPAPRYRRGRLEPWGLFVAVGVVPLVVCVGLWTAHLTPAAVSLGAVLLVAGIVPAWASAFANRRAPFNALAALSVGALMLASSSRSVRGDVIFADRSFFGVSRVIESADHTYRLLQHGTTLHGRQNLDGGPGCEPQSYYDAAGPVGDLFQRSGRHFTSVAIVGLGSGALACYAEPGSRWTFFEIDPLIERIATNPALFTFLRRSPGNVEIAIGDGRKQIEASAPAAYDLIVLDAFSSDAVPTHLLTREAFAAYLSRLRPDGLIAAHVSNRYLDLEPVIAAVADEQALVSWTNQSVSLPPAEMLRGRSPAQWIVLSRESPALAALAATNKWRTLVRHPRVDSWTDDYSNLLRSVRWE